VNRSPLLVALCAVTLNAAGAVQSANSFNPAISLVLNTQYSHYDKDASGYRLPGFLLNPESGLSSSGMSLGESEMTLSASIDPHFFAQTTLAFDGDAGVSVEESFIQTLGLGEGMTLKFGRFFSAMGYLNEKHAHAWTFIDAPLIYRGLFGDQLKVEGVQGSWLLPTDHFMQVGAEALNGAWTAFYTLADDWDESQSWQLGLSYWQSSKVAGRVGQGLNSELQFDGESRIGSVDFVYKWAPNGNQINENFKFQLEYFDRHESGQLSAASGFDYQSDQRGWYAQGVYQFRPQWSVALRYDHLSSSNSGADEALLKEEGLTEGVTPQRYSALLAWSPSEFSHIRLQYSQDGSYDSTDNQLFLHYSGSLGSHGAHQY